MNKLFHRCLLIAGMIAATRAANSAVIFGNITSPGAQNGLYIDGSTQTAFPGQPQDLAVAFTPASTSQMTSAKVELEFVNGAPDQDSVNLSIYSSLSNLPGALLDQIATNVSAPPLSGTAPPTQVSLSTPFTLQANTQYWLVITPYSTDSTVFWDWGGSQFVPIASAGNGGSWNSRGQEALQFEIDGTRASAPEPSTILLVGLPLLCGGLFRRRTASKRHASRPSFGLVVAFAARIRRALFPLVCASALLIPASAQTPYLTWSQASPATDPPAPGASTSPMVYDSARSQMVLPVFTVPTPTWTVGVTMWLWDGSNWTSNTPPHGPLVLTGFALAYDSAHGETVLFGGQGYPSPFPPVETTMNQTWVWNRTDWTQMFPQHQPSARTSPLMAYDTASGQVVLFGGTDRSGNLLSDTWTWDGTDWTQVTGSGPPARAAASMAYDSTHSQVVLFGGANAGGTLQDTWLWDGMAWAQGANAPYANPGASMSDYPPGNGVLMVEGARSISPQTNTDSIWDGSAWNQVTSLTIPAARVEAAMAYDTAHQQVVLFGGISEPFNPTPLNDTWLLETTAVAPAGTPFATAGNPQSTLAGQPFPFPLQVTVTDAAGNSIIGQTVTFSGPSNLVTFSPSSATTDHYGHASVTATATATAGSYVVTASTSASSQTKFLLSNVNPASATGPCLVTTEADDNSVGSLRYQVAACGKGGQITFASLLTRFTVSQDQDIQLIQDLTINGIKAPGTMLHGNGTARIFGNGASRIFFVNGGNITLENLTIGNGIARGGNGAAAQDGPGGGGAGMGGAVFVNAGALTLSNIEFSENQAIGGNAGAHLPLFTSTVLFGGGGGMGGNSLGSASADVSGFSYVMVNGGGGGDLGGAGGTGANGNGGPGAGGSGLNGNYFPGFGGGFGGGDLLPAIPASGTGGGLPPNGTFGGIGPIGVAGGGAGLGGAIFVRAGTLILLEGTAFSTNSAKGGTGTNNFGNGQGKGGAIFINSGATAVYLGPFPEVSGDYSSSADSGTLCNTVVGASALDNQDVCGVIDQASVTAYSGSGQSAMIDSPFPQPLTLTITTAGGNGVPGVPLTFSGPTSGASINPATDTVATNGNGVGSLNVSANSSGGPYTVALSVGSIPTTVTYSLENLQPVNENPNVNVTYTGALYNRGTHLYTITFTVTNISRQPISGPLNLVLTGLPEGVLPTNSSGIFQNAPFWTVTAASLAPNASVQVQTQFSNSTNAAINFGYQIYSGTI